MKTFILTFAFTLYVGAALAGGTEVGSGGSVIVRDNEVILADPFVKKFNTPEVGERWTFSNELNVYLHHIQTLLERYGVLANENTFFWDKKIFSDKVEYRYTEELPCNDSMTIQDDIPGEVASYGCTQGNITWFKESLFKKLNLKQQALAVIHERLHSFSPESHDVLSDFISILQMMLTLQNEQFQGQYRTLSQDEIDAIYRLRQRAEELGFKISPKADAYSREIFPNGGGNIFRYKPPLSVASDAFIGIGSYIIHSPIGQGAIILNSFVRATSIGKESIILNSELDGINKVGENSYISNTHFSSVLAIFNRNKGLFPPKTYIGSQVHMENVSFKDFVEVSVKDRTFIADVYINEIDKESQHTTDSFGALGFVSLEFQEGASLKNVSLDVSSNDWTSLDTLSLILLGLPQLYKNFKDGRAIILPFHNKFHFEPETPIKLGIHLDGTGRHVIQDSNDLFQGKKH